MKRYRVSIVLSAAELMDMIPFLPDEFYVETVEMGRALQIPAEVMEGFLKEEVAERGRFLEPPTTLDRRPL